MFYLVLFVLVFVVWIWVCFVVTVFVVWLVVSWISGWGITCRLFIMVILDWLIVLVRLVGCRYVWVLVACFMGFVVVYNFYLDCSFCFG